MMTHDLSSALTDVRRAYRLLWAYQKRVIYYAGLIRDRLGFSHSFVDYYYSLPSDEVEANWTWDVLPLSLVGFVSTKQIATGSDGGVNDARPHAEEALLYAKVVSDSALEESYLRSEGNEPNALAFSDAAMCGSFMKLYILLGRNLFDINLKEDVLPEFDKMLGQTGGRGSVQNMELGIAAYAESIDLAEIGDLDTLVDHIERFRADASNALNVDL